MPVPSLRVKDWEPGCMGGIKPPWSKKMQRAGFGFFPVFPIDIQQFFDGRDLLRNLMSFCPYASQPFS